MGLAAFEGVVEEGRIRLSSEIRLPENTKVYVIVPGLRIEHVAHVASPRLARPEQIKEFQLEVAPESADAGV